MDDVDEGDEKAAVPGPFGRADDAEDGLLDEGVPVRSLPLGFGRAGGAWGLGNQLAVFSVAQPEERLSTLQRFRPGVHERRLMRALHQVFVFVDERSREPETRLDALRKASRHYRAEAEDYLSKAPQVGSFAPDVLRATGAASPETTWSNALALWHCAEIFFFEPSPVVAPLLVHWIHSVNSVAEPPEDGASRDEVWRFVARRVLQGRTREAVAALRTLGPQEDIDPLVDLLLHVPSLSRAPMAPEELMQEMEQFRAVVAKLQPSAAPYRQAVYRLLQGDVSDVEELVRDSGLNWLDSLAASLIYGNPLMTREEIAVQARALAEAAADDEIQSEVVTMLLVMERNAHALVRSFAGSPSLAPIAVHIADLLWRADYLPPVPARAEEAAAAAAPRKRVLLDLRHQALLDYVETFAFDAALWQMAPAYLAQCGAEGTALLRTVVSRVEPRTDREALKVLSVCARFRLDEEAAALQRQMAHRALREGRVSAAVHWFSELNDAPNLDAICDGLLLRAARTEGDVSDAVYEQVDCIVAHARRVDCSPRVLFLSKFRDLLQLLRGMREAARGAASGDDRQRREALEIIVRSLDARLAPHVVWLRLLQIAAQLLAEAEAPGKPPLLAVDDAALLLGCLEELELSIHAREYLGDHPLDALRFQLLSTFAAAAVQPRAGAGAGAGAGGAAAVAVTAAAAAAAR